MTYLHCVTLYLWLVVTRKPSIPPIRFVCLGSFSMLAGFLRQTLECTNMLDVSFNLESQQYFLWKFLQAAEGSGLSDMRLKSSQRREVLLLPLALDLLYLVVGRGSATTNCWVDLTEKISKVI